MRASLLLLLTAGCLGAAEVYPLLVADGRERLTHADFEQPAGWWGWEQGFSLAPGEGRAGSTAAVCRRAAVADRAQGVAQTVTLDQTEPRGLVVSGWSRAASVTGSPDSDYSLYCDLVYTDGTPLWGQVARFATGSHDWQRARVTIVPDKPVRSLTVYGLLRRSHTGTAWFDDFSVMEQTLVAGGARLDGLPVAVQPTAPLKGEPVRAGDLALVSAGNALGSLSLAGQPLGGRGAGGLLVRDVAAGSGFHSVAGELALAADLTVTPHDQRLDCGVALRDLGHRARALTVLLALPVAPDGLRWGHDLDHDRPVETALELTNAAGVECGSNGLLARYPLATVCGPHGGLTLAIAPDRPAQYRLGYSTGAQVLWLAWDVALLPDGSAQLGAALLPSDGAWALRGGLEAWRRAFPDYSRVRTPAQGIWQAFAKTSQVREWQDFGFMFKEGDDEPAWDAAHGLLTFRYSEMGTYWMSMPAGLPRTYENALAILKEQAANPKNRHAWQYANAVLSSGVQAADGRLQLEFQETPWTKGCVWSLNPSPALGGEATQAKLCWGPERQRAYEPGGLLAGEYLDSLEGYVTAALDYRPGNLAAARTPLTFDGECRPVYYKGLAIAEFTQMLSEDLHRRGKLLMANGVPYRYGFMCAWLDVLGTETDWGRGGQYTPDGDDLMGLRRALAGRKPYLLLLNTQFEPFGPYVERYLQRALAYGMWPSMFSHNASEDHYFTKPAWYERDRAAFRKWIPQIRRVAEAGWEPVTRARCDNPRIRVERFGERLFTVHNPTAEAQAGTVAFADGRRREVRLGAWETEVWEG